MKNFQFEKIDVNNDIDLKQYAENINKWLEEVSKNDKFKDHLSLYDIRKLKGIDEQKVWDNVNNLSRRLGVKFETGGKGWNTKEFQALFNEQMSKVNSFAGDKKGIESNSRREMNSLSKDLKQNSGNKNESLKQNETLSDKDFLLKFNGATDVKDRTKVLKLQKILNGMGFKGRDGKGLAEDGKWGRNTIFALTEFYSKDSAQKKSQNIENSKNEANGKKEISTGENVTKIKATDIFSNAETKAEFLGEINLPSMEKIILNADINKLYKGFLDSIKGNRNENGDYDFNFYDVGTAGDYLKGLGYSPNGTFGGREAGAIFQLISDTYYTQLNINTKSPADKIKILVDFNIDGVLDDKINFNSTELGALNAIKDNKTFNKVLKNLGLNPSEFNNLVSTNYYKARKELKTAISRFAEMPETDLSQLLLNERDFKKSQEYVVNKLSLSKAIEKEFSKDKRVKEIQAKYPEVWKEVKNVSINAVIGDLKGGVATSDSIGKKVSEVTNGVIDNVSLGYVNGTPSFIIGGGKNIGDKLNVGAGLANGLPFVNISGKIKEADLSKIKTLFPKTMDTQVTVGVGGTLNILGTGGGFEVGVANEKNSKGIEAMVKRMDELLNPVFEKIVSNSSFETTGLENTKENKEAYNNLKKYYEASGANPNLVPLMKQGILRAYQNELYTNAKGFNINGLTLGKIGPFILPGLSMENIHITFTNKGETLGKEAVNEISLTEKISSFDENSIEKTKEINNFLSNKIDAKLANNLKSLGVKIHKFLNGKTSLVDAWNTFQKEAQKLFGTEFKNKLPKNLNDSDKTLILQNVAINLMKKEGLQMREGNVDIKNGLSIESYDKKHNRTKFFDKIFSKEFPDLLPSIKTAREKYYKMYGDKKTYGVGQLDLSDGISFSGVATGGINPYAIGHIATFDGGQEGKVKIEQKSSSIIKKIPNHLLEGIISTLEDKGHNFGKDKYNEARKILEKGQVGNTKIDYDLYFTKDPECLNDKILLDLKVSGEPVRDWKTYVGEVGRTKIGISYAKNTEKPKNTPEKPKEEEPPKKEEPPKTPENQPNGSNAETTPGVKSADGTPVGKGDSGIVNSKSDIEQIAVRYNNSSINEPVAGNPPVASGEYKTQSSKSSFNR